MKVSNYNFVFPYPYEEGKRVLYNSRSNAMALIEEDKYQKFKDFCVQDTHITDEKLFKDLKYAQFIIESDVNELDLIRYGMLQNRYRNNGMALTIAPTSDCNFRCVYCYEKDSIKNMYMSDEVQSKLIDFVKNRAREISDLTITWYGGEPLLKFDIIEYLSEIFISICNENKIKYSASIITNGYLLTKEIAEKFSRLKISFMQITIDGPPDEHNKRRPLVGGGPTFDNIITNLRNVKDLLSCTVALRINTDKKNVDSVKKYWTL